MYSILENTPPPLTGREESRMSFKVKKSEKKRRKYQEKRKKDGRKKGEIEDKSIK
jgi:hypothetical protein